MISEPGQGPNEVSTRSRKPLPSIPAAVSHRLREQVKEGVDQLSALLESVMLLGQLAQDIAVVKADIKQVGQTPAL